MLDRFHTLKDFMVVFNPSFQRSICDNQQECYFGEYPTLALVKSAFGSNASVAWMVPQLIDLSEFCGVRDKLTAHQAEEMAFIISTEYFYLKISEMMLFFHRFKTGRYGRFYGSVDPMLVMEALGKFVIERSAAYEKRDRELAVQRIDEGMKDAISWEEYCQRNGISDKKNPLERIRETIL